MPLPAPMAAAPTCDLRFGWETVDILKERILTWFQSKVGCKWFKRLIARGRG